MRYSLSVDFEDDEDIDSFLEFIRYHSKRLKCPTKDVFIKLANEWKKQQEVPILDLSNAPKVTKTVKTPTKKKTTRQPYKNDDDQGMP